MCVPPEPAHGSRNVLGRSDNALLAALRYELYGGFDLGPHRPRRKLARRQVLASLLH